MAADTLETDLLTTSLPPVASTGMSIWTRIEPAVKGAPFEESLTTYVPLNLDWRSATLY